MIIPYDRPRVNPSGSGRFAGEEGVAWERRFQGRETPHRIGGKLGFIRGQGAHTISGVDIE